MHPVLPALLVFVFVLLFVFEVALGAVLVVTAFAMMRAWAGEALRSRPIWGPRSEKTVLRFRRGL